MKPTSPTVWLDMTFGFLYWRNSRTPLFRRRCRMPNPPIQLALVGGCRHRSLPWGWRYTAEKIRGHSQRELFPLEPKCGGGETSIWNGIHFNLLRRRAHNTPVRMFQASVGACSGDGLTTGGRQVRRSINKMSRLHGKYICTAAEPKCRGDGLTTYPRCSRCDQHVCFISCLFSFGTLLCETSWR